MITDNGSKTSKNRYFVRFVMKIRREIFLDAHNAKLNFTTLAYSCGFNRAKHVQIVDYNFEKL